MIGSRCSTCLALFFKTWSERGGGSGRRCLVLPHSLTHCLGQLNQSGISHATSLVCCRFIQEHVRLNKIGTRCCLQARSQEKKENQSRGNICKLSGMQSEKRENLHAFTACPQAWI